MLALKQFLLYDIRMGSANRKVHGYLAKILLAVVFIVGLFGLPSVAVETANAASCGVDSSGKPVQTFFNWNCDNKDGKKNEQITPLLVTIVNWMAAGVAIAVIGGIVYGAILYTSSGGNAEQSKKAMGVIRNAIIALVLYFAMWSLINWLVPGGLFN